MLLVFRQIILSLTRDCRSDLKYTCSSQFIRTPAKTFSLAQNELANQPKMKQVTVPQVILTSFHRAKRMQGDKFSICRFQPTGFALPELRFFAAEDANGQKLRIKDVGGVEKFEQLYREALASRWKEVSDWLDWLRRTSSPVLLLCWCPFSEETKASVKTDGTFLCHSGLIGKLINRHCPETRLMLDEERARQLDVRWRPERYEVVNAYGEVELQQSLF